MLFLTNRMPNFTGTGSVSLQPVDPRKVVENLQGGFISLVDNASLAKCLSGMLGVNVPTKQFDIAPKIGEDTVVIVNCNGTIPNNATTLPANVSIQFSVIESKRPMLDIKGIKRGIANWLLEE